MDEDYDFEGRSEQEVLLSFTANKGHRTRQAKKINNLLTLQDQKYSKATEQTLLQIVSALERYQDRLNIFASWLSLDMAEQLASMTVNNPLENQQGTAQAVHSLYSTASNQPTPTMLL